MRISFRFNATMLISPQQIRQPEEEGVEQIKDSVPLGPLGIAMTSWVQEKGLTVLHSPVQKVEPVKCRGLVESRFIKLD